MLKLTLAEPDDLYAEFVAHPHVLKVVALSGGYSRDEANARLARQHGVVASFSRALTEGLTAQQSDAEFNAALDGRSRAFTARRSPEGTDVRGVVRGTSGDRHGRPGGRRLLDDRRPIAGHWRRGDGLCAGRHYATLHDRYLDIPAELA